MESIVEVSVESGLLVRVFAVAQDVSPFPGNGENLRESGDCAGCGLLGSGCEVVGDDPVVTCGVVKYLGGKFPAQVAQVGAVAECLDQPIIVRRIRDDRNMAVVLGCAPEE